VPALRAPRAGREHRAAAVRETREETGIALDPEALRLAVSVHQRSPGGHARIGFAFEPGAWSGEPVNTLPHKHSELVWADPAALPPDTVGHTAAVITRRRTRRLVHSQRLVTVDSARRELADLWPQFGLLIETPRLQLRLPREDELPALTRAARDLAGPAAPRLQMPWMYGPSPAMERQLLQRHWRALAHWKPGSWHLPLAVFLAGEPAGMQVLWAEDFAVRRSVASDSWITRARQGRGYGTEARAAVLELAFGRLGAAEALTDYTEGNHASERVSRKLGYTPNGRRTVNHDGTGRVTEYQLRLDRPAWEASTRHEHTIITGLGPCLPMLGLAASDDGVRAGARPPGHQHHGAPETAPRPAEETA
jgi:RimJ/RimL family protein N-acetyltransferase